jgi:hypothetical protein
VVDESDEIGIGEQVGELVADVAVVDVHRNRPQLEAGQHGLDELGPVVEVEPHVVARPYPEVRQRVCQPGAALVEDGVGLPAISGHQRLTVADRVGHALEQIGQVELHRRRPSLASGSRSLPASSPSGRVRS